MNTVTFLYSLLAAFGGAAFMALYTIEQGIKKTGNSTPVKLDFGVLINNPKNWLRTFTGILALVPTIYFMPIWISYVDTVEQFVASGEPRYYMAVAFVCGLCIGFIVETLASVHTKLKNFFPKLNV